MRTISLSFILILSTILSAQNVMTPDLLWQLGRVSAMGISKDGKNVVFKVSIPSVELNNFSSKYYTIPVEGGNVVEIADYQSLLNDKHLSPDGKHILYSQKVKLNPVAGSDFYPELRNSTAKIYNELHHRHWDQWQDGSYNHLFFKKNEPGATGTDLLEGQPFHCPLMPFGGVEDYTWSADGKSIVYISKKLSGTEYVLSTNTDIYQYRLETGQTTNLSEGMKGYDTEPAFSSKGILAWLSMERNGFEADKNDLIVLNNGLKINLTKNWDGTVNHFVWSKDGSKLYFTAPIGGTIQLFEIAYNPKAKKDLEVKQLSEGQFDVTGIVGEIDNKLIVSRSDMNHASELYSFDLKNKQFKQLTNVNTDSYSKIKLSKVEKRMVKTTDNKEMLVWMIYPPDFDPNKKYPTLLYCQGGPQSALSQFYSFRWNFQVMAAQGYIIVAPNRRGMPGHGTKWNEQISKDWGGQVMDDYLSAIDDVANESYVDKDRLGAIGASYGGYSVFYLAGNHNKRFKTFISHAGVFNTESMYGTTEEVFFTNWDLGGAYWEKNNADATNAYGKFNPLKHVTKWDTPMLIIHGGTDYRVPYSQSLEAYQAAQLQGIKSRFVYFPDENHWILQPQNGIVWQREFFKWLNETL
jgi:dipeptidyl aminopeptidase/acylaminoacyl peptidase